jgi:hypothetical protein
MVNVRFGSLADMAAYLIQINLIVLKSAPADTLTIAWAQSLTARSCRTAEAIRFGSLADILNDRLMFEDDLQVEAVTSIIRTGR